MKTIKYICIFCLAILLFSCGKSTKDLVTNQWSTIHGSVSVRAGSYLTAQKYFKEKHGENNDTWMEKYKEFQTKLIEILKSRVFDLKEDGAFSMTSAGNNVVNGTWEYGLGSEFETIEFKVNGKLFEIWKARLCGNDDCGFKRLSPKDKYKDSHVDIFARYTNEEFKEIMGESTFSVELDIAPKNTEGFDVR